MSTPNPKRRRLNSSTTALHKPFKSPLRTPLKPHRDANGGIPSTPLKQCETIQSTNLEDAPTLTATSDTLSTSSRPLQPIQPMQLPTPHQAAYLTRRPPSHPFSTINRFNKPSSPAYTALQLRLRTLQTHLAALKSDIDTIHQAIRIERSCQDNDLGRLINKWQVASRDAAEEVFVGVRDRVNRMGGVGAWRERERERRARAWEDELETRKAWIKEMRGSSEHVCVEDSDDTICEESEGKGGPQDILTGGNDDDSFTMDIMLQTLNIDLDVIGYDKEGQRWTA